VLKKKIPGMSRGNKGFQKTKKVPAESGERKKKQKDSIWV